ncbi:MAG: leucine-rich repeat protein [Oscillospiraceae bacterium]|nr:leucine-rich repeat protein [Oscillospiraceae bacterium]
MPPKKEETAKQVFTRYYQSFAEQYGIEGYAHFLDIISSDNPRIAAEKLVPGKRNGLLCGTLDHTAKQYRIQCIPVDVPDGAAGKQFIKQMKQLTERYSYSQEIEEYPEEQRIYVALALLQTKAFGSTWFNEHLTDAVTVLAELDNAVLLQELLNMRPVTSLKKKDLKEYQAVWVDICEQKGAEKCLLVLKNFCTGRDVQDCFINCDLLCKMHRKIGTDRGEYYFLDGHVQEYVYENGHVQAVAAGTELYTVSLRVDEDQVTSADCTCPDRQKGNFCKHIVAAACRYFYELGAAEYDKAAGKTAKKPAAKPKSPAAKPAPESSPASPMPEIDPEIIAKAGLTLEGGTLTACKPPKKLPELVLPEGIAAISAGAFTDARIDKLILPSTVISIPDGCFTGWKAIKEIDLGNGVAEIGSKAFDGCEKLTTLHIGTGLKAFKKDLIGECKKLDNIHISPDNKKLSSYFGTVFDKKQSKPSYVPYHKSELILPPTLVNFTTNCIVGKIKTLTFDLRGSSADALLEHLVKGKQDFAIRSVNTLRFLTDTQEYTLELSGCKSMVEHPFYPEYYPEKHTVKHFVGMVTDTILYGSTTFKSFNITHKHGGHQRLSYWYNTGLWCETAAIIAGLFGKDKTALCVAAAKGWCEIANAYATDTIEIDRISHAMEKYPAGLGGTLGCERAVRACISLYAQAGDALRGYGTAEELERAIAISVEENAPESTAVLLQMKYELEGNADPAAIQQEIERRFAL